VRTYIIKRLLLVIPTMLLVSIVVFFLMRLIPGDIIDQMVDERLAFTEVERGAIERAMGLDVPVVQQYGRWLGVVPNKDGNFSGILQGDLGMSLWSPTTPVARQIFDRLPVTLELGLLALLMQVIIAMPIGVYSAIRQDTVTDYLGRSFATLLIALPSFWVGLMIILAASLWLGMSPQLRAISFFEDPIGNLGQFIVPAFVLSMAGVGTVMRMTRAMMLEVLRQDYIRTAWAKGLRERVVVTKHALKNALIPVVTHLGLRVRVIVGGSVIIESVFSLPGIGRLLVEATWERDYTIISGVTFFLAFILLIINLLVDLAYGYLDPRVHYK